MPASFVAGTRRLRSLLAFVRSWNDNGIGNIKMLGHENTTLLYGVCNFYINIEVNIEVSK